jgi:hypothetical protein
MHGSEEDPVVPAVAGDDPSTNAAITPTPAIMVTGDLMSHSTIFATQSTTLTGRHRGGCAYASSPEANPPYATLLSAARGSRRRAVRLRASALGARFGGS